MKTNKFKSLSLAFSLLIALSVLSSCNRGVGCPSEFSVDKTVLKVVKEVATSTAQNLIK